MIRIRKAILFLAISLFVAWQAAAAPVQRIHQIQKPLFNEPAIVQAGAAFELRLKPDDGQIPEAVELVPVNGDGSATISLTIPSQNVEGGEQVYMVGIPADAPEALYDLKVGFSDGETDTQPHAVKVVSAFKDDYIFVHLTDIHFNMGNDPLRNVLRMKIMDDVTALNPEFVLFSGDLGLNPATYDVDYVFAYESFLEHLGAPVFMTPGNHEMYIDDVDGRAVDGREYWEAAYGPMYHSFDYGPLHVATICTYDWPPRWRDKREEETVRLKINNLGLIGPEQWEWLQRDFADAASRGQHIIAHTHIPLEFLQGGNRMGLTNPEVVEGPSLQKFTKFLNHYNVSHVFAGHVHFSSERAIGDGTLEVITVGAGHNPGSGGSHTFGFRILHVVDGVITDMEVREYTLDDVRPQE